MEESEIKEATEKFDDHSGYPMVETDEQFYQAINNNVHWLTQPSSPETADPQYDDFYIAPYGGNFSPEVRVRGLYHKTGQGRVYAYAMKAELWFSISEKLAPDEFGQCSLANLPQRTYDPSYTIVQVQEQVENQVIASNSSE